MFKKNAKFIETVSKDIHNVSKDSYFKQFCYNILSSTGVLTIDTNKNFFFSIKSAY